MTKDEIIACLETFKARDIEIINIDDSLLADHMIVCTGSSNVHLNALSRELAKAAKATQPAKPTIHGPSESGWVLIDLEHTIVHIMLDEQRRFYQLEKLWDKTLESRSEKN